MSRKKVKAVVQLWEPFVWILLGLFAGTHVVVLITYATEAMSQEDFLRYCNVTEVATHAFAMPSLLGANIEGVREVITLATVVSIVYHYVENFTTSDTVPSWHTMDRATATGLIATVFLKFLAHLHHSDALIVLLVGVAASVHDGGNVLAAGIVALVFLLAIVNQKTQGFLQKLVTAMVNVLSLGGTTSEPEATVFSPEETRDLWVALVLNVVAVAAFVFATMNKDYDQWSHSLWHAFVYTVLWRLVVVLVSVKDRGTRGIQRESRTVYDMLVSTNKRKWRLGTGQWR